MNEFALYVVWFLVIFIYFLPTLVGWSKQNAAAIFTLNLLLGWTVLGWVGALIWAMTADPKPGD